MPFKRFDQQRLIAVLPRQMETRSCRHSLALVQACRLGAGPGTRALFLPWQAPRIEWRFGVLHVHNLDVARRACLLLDGSWRMQDAASGAQRMRIRLAAQFADNAWWRPLGDADAWDAGLASSMADLAGFCPRRATLIVLEHTALDDQALRMLADLEQQSTMWSRAVRLVVAGGQAPAFARPVAG
jgi:hypothetical protein